MSGTKKAIPQGCPPKVQCGFGPPTAQTDPQNGAVYADLSTGCFYTFNGTEWVTCGVTVDGGLLGDLTTKTIDVIKKDGIEETHGGGPASYDFAVPFVASGPGKTITIVSIEGSLIKADDPNFPYAVTGDAGKTSITFGSLPDDCKVCIVVIGCIPCTVLTMSGADSETTDNGGGGENTNVIDGTPICDADCETQVNSFSSSGNTPSWFLYGNQFLSSGTDVSYTGNDIATSVDLIVDYGDGSAPVTIPGGVTSSQILMSQVPPHTYTTAPGTVVNPTFSFTTDAGIDMIFGSQAIIGDDNNVQSPAFLYHANEVTPAGVIDCDGPGVSIEIEGSTQGGATLTGPQTVTVNGNPLASVSSPVVIPPSQLVTGTNTVVYTQEFTSNGETLTAVMTQEFKIECV